MDQDTLQVMLREAVRQTVTEVLQILLDADREAFLRQHGGRKNGYYPRKLGQPLRGYLVTTFGQVEVAIPRDREGRYYPSFPLLSQMCLPVGQSSQPYTRRQVDVGGQLQATFWWR